MSRTATGKTPARFYVVTCRVTPIKATSTASACRMVEKATPRHGALIGRSFAVGSPEEAEAALARVGPSSGRVVEVRVEL